MLESGCLQAPLALLERVGVKDVLVSFLLTCCSKALLASGANRLTTMCLVCGQCEDPGENQYSEHLHFLLLNLEDAFIQGDLQKCFVIYLKTGQCQA